MDRTRLQRALDAADIRPNAYSLEGGLPDRAYVLEQRLDGWAVYYSQVGQRSREVVHRDEATASRHLLAWVLADRSTRRQVRFLSPAPGLSGRPETPSSWYSPAEQRAITQRAHRIRAAWARAGEVL